jgi:hypothetical protein
VTAPEPVRRPTSEPVDHFEEPANGKTVPDPVEPSKDDRPVVSPTGYDEETLVQPRNKKTSQRTKPQSTDDGDVARSERGSRRLSLDSDLEPPNDDESGLQTAEFQTRVRAGGVQPVSAERMSDANEEHGPEERYGYDSEGYTWLKGIAEFDRKHQTWHLIYDRSPDDADQFGGEVTFKHRPEFAKLLRSGQAIYVEGHFDEGQQDRLGKPLYDVEAYRPIDKAERSVR